MLIKTHTQDLMLSQFSLIESLPLEMQPTMRNLYNHKDKAYRALGSILNHCFTSRVNHILITRPSINAGLEDDPNATTKVLDSRNYKRLLGILSRNDVFQMVVGGKSTGQRRKGIGSLFRLVHKEVLRHKPMTEHDLQCEGELLTAVYSRALALGGNVYDPNGIWSELLREQGLV